MGLTKFLRKIDRPWTWWLLTRKYYHRATGKQLHYYSPKEINEKSLWLTRFWQTPLKAICADKYRVRWYLKRRGLGHLSVPLIAVYNNANEIDFDKLPNQFVLKCNHGSGMNIICTDKSKLDIAEARQQLNEWLAEDFSKRYQEVYYHDMERKIVCEELISETAPTEYQFWCVNGQPDSILVCRKNFNGTYDSWSYSLNWERLHERVSETEAPAPKPENLDQLISYAMTLAEPFQFLRADFYEVKGRIYFAEMTFTPSAGILVNYKPEVLERMGAKMRLPHQTWEHPNLKDIKRDHAYVERFVEEMRRTAKEIGMETVELDDPSGMSFMNRGTVIDLAALMKYAIENSSLLRDTGSQPTHRMLYLRRGVRPCRRNLVSTIDYNAFASDKYRIVGAKTGSGDGIYNLMMGLVYNDATYVAIVANAHSEEQRTIEMKALLAYMIGKKSETELKNVASNESCVLLGKIQNGALMTIFTQNEKQMFPLLSTTKILTLLLVERYYQYLPKVVRIKDYDTMWEAPEWLTRKSIAKTEDLIYAMLLPSSNISAYAFARIIGSKLK